MRSAIMFAVALLGAGLAGWSVTADTLLDTRVLPAADRLGPLDGDPPARPAFAGDRLIGYVFSSLDVAETKGYGGQPLDLMIGLDLDGRIAGVEIIEENEPILATGRTREDLDAFVRGFAGRDIQATIRLERVGSDEHFDSPDQADAISGATITSYVLQDAIINSARAVGRSRGLIDDGGVDLDRFEPQNWADLMASGGLVQRLITVGEVQDALQGRGGTLFPPAMGEIAPDARLLDIYLALTTPAMIGRNLLGSKIFERWRSSHPAGTHMLLIAGNGRHSFKGTGWRKSGRFERMRLLQDDLDLVFTADDHTSLEMIAAENAPDMREFGLFKIDPATGFRADRPFALELIFSDHQDPAIQIRSSIDYQIPAILLKPVTVESPLWQRIWWERRFEIAILCAGLLLLTTMLIFQDALAQRPVVWRRLRVGFLALVLLGLGLYANAQLSVVHVLTFADALRGTFRWEQFLLEPLIFILWGYVAIALVFWGRGVFCGWLCPFGALQEFVFMLGTALRLPQKVPPFGLHERLRAIKFVLFMGLIAIALGSVGRAHQFAEIEPFKTVIVLKFDHAWPYVAYALVILLGCLFVQRLFCRYLCPLGAALALPARVRQFEWLKRRHQCGQRCRICEVTCPVGAIQPSGEIHPGECIYCLRCQINYFDDHICPPMIERRRRIEARELLGKKL